MAAHGSRPALSTRERLLELLHWEPLTVDQLAAEVGLTLNGVRAQLTAMERDGLVERTAVPPSGRVGKPPAAFGLTHRAREDRSSAYPSALGAMIRALVARHGARDACDVLHAAGLQLAGAQGNAQDAVVALEQLGAVVRRTTDSEGTDVVEGAGCPLATAVRTEPLTCELVRSLLAARLDRQVEMRCRHGNAPACRFAIGAAQPE